MAVFYAVPFTRSEDEYLQAARTFLTAFMTGYNCENTVDTAWFEQLPYFLKARELGVYAALHAHHGPDLERLEGRPDDWDARYMVNRKHRIEHDVPYIDLDFVEIAAGMENREGR